jgi:hypothetical protein
LETKISAHSVSSRKRYRLNAMLPSFPGAVACTEAVSELAIAVTAKTPSAMTARRLIRTPSGLRSFPLQDSHRSRRMIQAPVCRPLPCEKTIRFDSA